MFDSDLGDMLFCNFQCAVTLFTLCCTIVNVVVLGFVAQKRLWLYCAKGKVFLCTREILQTGPNVFGNKGQSSFSAFIAFKNPMRFFSSIVGFSPIKKAG